MLQEDNHDQHFLIHQKLSDLETKTSINIFNMI